VSNLSRFDSKHIGGSNTILYKSIRHVYNYFIYNFQARTKARNKESSSSSNSSIVVGIIGSNVPVRCIPPITA
jgi:hypothetical protein